MSAFNPGDPLPPKTYIKFCKPGNQWQFGIFDIDHNPVYTPPISDRADTFEGIVKLAFEHIALD